AEEEAARVDQRFAVGRYCQLRLVLGNRRAAKRRGRVGIVERVAGWQVDLDAIVFGPRVVEIDRVLSSRGGEHRFKTVLKKRGLEEQTFAGALRVTRKAHVVRIDQRVDMVRNVLDLDVRD